MSHLCGSGGNPAIPKLFTHGPEALRPRLAAGLPLTMGSTLPHPCAWDTSGSYVCKRVFR